MAPNETSGLAGPQEADSPCVSEHSQFAHAERAAKFGTWRLRLADNHLTWSPGMYHLLGLDPAAQKADSDWLLDQVVPEDVAAFRRKVTEAIKTRTSFYHRSRAKNPNASIKIVDTHGEVETGPNGHVLTVLGVCHDVTEHIAAETARKRAEETYRAMIEQASDIVLLYDADGRIVCASDALERVLERSVGEIDDKRYLDLIHPDDIAEAAKLAIKPRPDETLTATYRVRHGDGHYVWMEATTRGIYDENTDELRNVVSVSRDITERKNREFETAAARDRAEAANSAKSAFLANMSHELRTPLNAIIGFADVMRQQMFGPLGARRYEEYTNLIFDSGQLLLDLISDVLDMAKIEAGKLDLSFEQVDLRAVAEDCVRLMQERAQKHEVEITAALPDGDVSLQADRRAIKQILLNLLSNAVKFTLPGGHIAVQAYTAAGRVIVAVQDDGVGIPAVDLPRLGRPFEQVRTDPALTTGGTGLGLALVRALADKHGGTVRIESEEGIGTTVSVELPVTQDGARVAA